MHVVLLDESLPQQLRHELTGHRVSSVAYNGWSALSNGALLAAAEEGGFTVFITGDQSLQFQQNLSASALGIIVLCAQTNRLKHLQPLCPRILQVLETISPGQIVEIR